MGPRGSDTDPSRVMFHSCQSCFHQVAVRLGRRDVKDEQRWLCYSVWVVAVVAVKGDHSRREKDRGLDALEV